MRLAAPERLWLLALVVLLAVAYIAGQVRRARHARRFADPARLPSLVPRRLGPWRHALAALFVAAMSVMAVGAAEPTIAGEQRREVATVVVAIDVSDSMGATDVRPDRITAAVRAAQSFVGDLPSGFEVGLVTAGAAPSIVVPPTRDHELVQGALDRLTLSPGTALGEAIFTALAALPPPDDQPIPDEQGPRSHIVLLSDGVTTTGRPDAEAIDAAVDAGVPVSTIAFGTDDATVESQGVIVDVAVDERALRAIANGTGGRFFEAASAAELGTVYEEIDAGVTVVIADRSVADWFAAAAFVLLFGAVVASLMTTGRAAWA